MTVAEALKKTVTPEVRRRMDRELCESIRRLIPTRINRLTVSQWAEANRILPSSVTPMPGPFKFAAVPYMREIADCFSESSPVQKVVVMKGAQIAFTTAVLENVIGYIIAACPGPSMFVSADKGVAEASVELRIDAMIQSAGLADRIFAQVEKRHGKKTGDTKARKDFPGGFLMAIGPRVGGKLRSFPIRYLLGDELDAWPWEVGASDTGKTAAEGDPLALAEKRTVAFERTRKILLGSTPLIKQTSKIERLFQSGDRRYYYVPCKYPDCGHMQRLRWRDEDGNYRLKFEKDAEGRLIPESVRYECEECGRPWTNDDKAWFLPRGEWRPTAQARELGMRSYHLSALYAPVGMRTWSDIAAEWLQIGDDVGRLRAFINTTLGESFEERGITVQPERIRARAEGYAAGTLPEGARPALITAGVDVQDDRIEAEVVAWGRDAESWSIEYAKFFSDSEEGTSSLDNKAWAELRAFLEAPHAGYGLQRILVDEGGGHEGRTEVVRLFCESFPHHVHPVKGAAPADGRGSEKVFTRSEIAGHREKTILANVGYLKEIILSYLNRGTPDGLPPREPLAGYCHFPIDYDDAYFRGLASEEKFIIRGRDGRRAVRWRKVHTRNEPLDCRAYALLAVFMAYEECRQEAIEKARKLNLPDPKYGWAEFWEYAEGEIAGVRSQGNGGGAR